MTIHYKNKAAILLESESLCALFLPNPGGKMVSLINKKTGYEFLVQRPGAVYLEQPFAGLYTAAECSGFDDMMPTIDECRCENFPWEGTVLADHGEVWSVPWNVITNQPNTLTMGVHGVRFPYYFEKTISLNGDTVSIDYVLSNRSPFDFDYLWAGHLMINLEVGTRLSVPDDCREVVSVLSNGSAKFGEIQQWPQLKDKNGQAYDARVSRPPADAAFEKYYFTNKLRDGWCVLDYPNGKDKLRISFTTDSVPYLGILMNENGWDGLYNIIVEPCSLCYDRPDLAKKYGQKCTLEGFETQAWNLSLSCHHQQFVK